MKFLGLIIGVFLLIAVFPQRVGAQQAWVESDSFCQPSLGLYPISRSQVKDSDEVAETMRHIEDNKLCSIDPNIEIWNITQGRLDFCPGDKVITKKIGGGYHSTCCPREPIDGQKFHYGFIWEDQCCPFGTELRVGTSDFLCRFEDGSVVVAQDADGTTYSVTDNEEYFKVGVSTYYCPTDGCLIDNPAFQRKTLLENNNTTSSPLSQSQMLNYICLPNGASMVGVYGPDGEDLKDQFCSYQQAVDPVVLTLVSINPDISSCQEIDDLAERQNCLDCFMKNIDPSNPNAPKAFVYSSIGCVDTRQNEFITRLFQIGFGMLGGFGVLRIMWGSILRQSTDPAKIQEGKDMITSSIWALITLAVTIPLLRFLGINLLQLLPINFLG